MTFFTRTSSFVCDKCFCCLLQACLLHFIFCVCKCKSHFRTCRLLKTRQKMFLLLVMLLLIKVSNTCYIWKWRHRRWQRLGTNHKFIISKVLACVCACACAEVQCKHLWTGASNKPATFTYPYSLEFQEPLGNSLISRKTAKSLHHSWSRQTGIEQSLGTEGPSWPALFRLWNTRRAIWDLAVTDFTAALSSFMWTGP